MPSWKLQSQAGREFLLDNGQRAEVTTTASGFSMKYWHKVLLVHAMPDA